MKKFSIIISVFIICIVTSSLYSQEIFKYDSSNSNLPESGFRCIAVDSTNTIWLGAQGAAYSLVNDNWIKIDSVLDLENDKGVFVTDIEVSPNGEIWFSKDKQTYPPAGKNLYLKKYDHWIGFDYDFGLRSPTRIFIENDSTIYLTLYNYWPHQLGEDAIGILQSEELTMIRLEYVFGISSVISTSKDTLVLSSWEGISIYDGDTNIVNNPSGIEPIKEELGLTKLNDRIFVYAEWLYEYANNSYISFPQIDSILAIDSSKITCVSIEPDNTLWFGTNDGKLIRYDETDIEVSNLVEDEILDLVVDKYGNKWFVTWLNGCYVYNENKIVEVEENVNYTQPNKYSLFQNYPNPFNPSTTIKYSIPSIGTGHAKSVRITVYDILGREVATLLNKEQKPGNYEVTFKADNLSSGIYYYRITAGSFVKTKKMILLR